MSLFRYVTCLYNSFSVLMYKCLHCLMINDFLIYVLTHAYWYSLLSMYHAAFIFVSFPYHYSYSYASHQSIGQYFKCSWISVSVFTITFLSSPLSTRLDNSHTIGSTLTISLSLSLLLSSLFPVFFTAHLSFLSLQHHLSRKCKQIILLS